MAATRGHVCLCSGHEIGLPAKLLRWFPRPGHISRIGAVIRRAYHHAQPLVGQLCVPLWYLCFLQAWDHRRSVRRHTTRKAIYSPLQRLDIRRGENIGNVTGVARSGTRQWVEKITCELCNRPTACICIGVLSSTVLRTDHQPGVIVGGRSPEGLREHNCGRSASGRTNSKLFCVIGSIH